MRARLRESLQALKQLQRALMHAHGLAILLCRDTDDPDDHLELVELVSTGEERLAQEELRNDAAHRPHVDRRAVRRVEAEQLRSRGVG